MRLRQTHIAHARTHKRAHTQKMTQAHVRARTHTNTHTHRNDVGVLELTVLTSERFKHFLLSECARVLQMFGMPDYDIVVDVV